jgi:Phosphorylase superfamily
LSVVVLVPQGAEYQAVKRGWGKRRQVSIVPIPAGLQAVQNWLIQYRDDPVIRSTDRVIVMGLCGGLRPDLAIGDAVIYASCQNFAQRFWKCETKRQCNTDIVSNAKSVKAISSNKVIATVKEKQFIREKYGCDVVDMEGAAILAFFEPLNIPVTMLRVVSDDGAGDIPDLSAAIDPNGKLQGRQLAIGLIKEPKKGLRLVRGAIVGLRALEKLAGVVSASLKQ